MNDYPTRPLLEQPIPARMSPADNLLSLVRIAAVTSAVAMGVSITTLLLLIYDNYRVWAFLRALREALAQL